MCDTLDVFLQKYRAFWSNDHLTSFVEFNKRLREYEAYWDTNQHAVVFTNPQLKVIFVLKYDGQSIE